jgi:hypothetical protein
MPQSGVSPLEKKKMAKKFFLSENFLLFISHKIVSLKDYR